MSRIDVIVPCYNYGRFLRGCVASVLDQDGVSVRVLIIDDASADDTPAIATRLMATDPRVEYRRHWINRGHIATYNEGLEWADGDYLLLLSADDMLTPGALHRAARALDDHPEVGMVCGRQVELQGEQAAPPEPSPPVNSRWRFLSGAEFIEEACRTVRNNVGTPTAVVRTALQRKLGGYNADLPHTADMEMWLRIAAHAGIGIIGEYQAYYRLHSRNMCRAYGGADCLGQREAALATLFRNHGHLLADVPRLEALAARKLAEDAVWMASLAFESGSVAHCLKLLDHALERDPTLVRWPPWWKVRLKLRLGYRAWRRIDPILGRIRATSRT